MLYKKCFIHFKFYFRDALATGVLSLTIGQSVNSTQLYNYILSHEKVYDFKVLRMEPLFVENEGGQVS